MQKITISPSPLLLLTGLYWGHGASAQQQNETTCRALRRAVCYHVHSRKPYALAAPPSAGAGSAYEVCGGRLTHSSPTDNNTTMLLNYVTPHTLQSECFCGTHKYFMLRLRTLIYNEIKNRFQSGTFSKKGNILRALHFFCAPLCNAFLF